MNNKTARLIFTFSIALILSSCDGNSGEPVDTSNSRKENSPPAASVSANIKKEQNLMGNKAAKTRFKVGTTTAPQGHYVKGLLELQKNLEKYSDGTMTIDIYPNSQLGNERDMMENVGMGVQAMTLISTGPIPNFAPDFAVLDLPYLFETAQDAYKVLDSDIGKNLLMQLDKQGIVGLGFWENGFRDLTNNTREVKTPAELKGLKIRTMENNVHMATYNSLGATATPMAWSEIFTALQQGIVDGQENPLAIIDSAKVYEVQKYITLNDIFYSPTVLMINKDVYNGLTDEQKEILRKAVDEAKFYQRNYSQNYNNEAIKVMTDKGVTITPVDKKAWKAAINYGDIIKKSGLKVDQQLLNSLLTPKDNSTVKQ